jgi:hypothetical protein
MTAPSPPPAQTHAGQPPKLLVRVRAASSAARSWEWQYVFPSARLSRDPRSGVPRRHHAHESTRARAFAEAVRQVKLGKRATSHSFATHLLEDGYAMRTTMIDTPVLNRGGYGVRSPLAHGALDNHMFGSQ